MQLALPQELPLFSSFSTFQAIIDFVLAVLELIWNSSEISSCSPQKIVIGRNR